VELVSKLPYAIFHSFHIDTSGAEYSTTGERLVMLRFTEDHEWLREDGETVVVGITEHAQEQLGDLVFVELPKPGSTLEQGAPAAVVESVKAASDVYAPVSGEIVEINQKIVDEPGVVNADAMGDGWLFKMKVSDRSQLDVLMDETAYRALVG
jgi:glycine cleavage system H protein